MSAVPRAIATFVIGVFGGVAMGAGPVTQLPDDDSAAALRDFDLRIGAYAALHQRLEAGLPPLQSLKSPRSILLARTYLAAAIKSARPHARQGDMFTPAVAPVVRMIIAKALAGRDPEAMLRDLFEEHPKKPGFHPRVYEPYPDWATHEMPAILLRHLPSLPEDVEYRLVNHDLVLWDIHADLIVDVLRDAIPGSDS
jgi:hypothetical protein